MAHIYTVNKLSDKKLLDIIDQLSQIDGYAYTGVYFDSVSIPEAALKTFGFTKDSQIITRADFSIHHDAIMIHFRRGVSGNTAQYDQIRSPSPNFDEFIIRANSNLSQHPENFVVCDKIFSKLSKVALPAYVENDADGAVAILNRQMEALGSQYAEMLSGLETNRASLDERYEAKSAKLDSETDARMQRIEQFRLEEEKRIAEKQSELAAKEKELDNRQHMHVRRGLRQQIHDDITTRLQKTVVSKTSFFMRSIVFVLALTLSSYLGLMSYTSLTQISELQSSHEARVSADATAALVQQNSPLMTGQFSPERWFLMIKSILSSLGAVAAFVYAIGWIRYLYLSDVRREYELEKYAFDINRASWAIETFMEMQISKDILPPQTWIEAICKNLFQNHLSDDDTTHNPLSTLLSSSTSVSIGPEGSRFEIKGAGAKKLAKEMEK